MIEYKVSEINSIILETIKQKFNSKDEFCIIGEVSDDLKKYVNKWSNQVTYYFTLKDQDKEKKHTITCVVNEEIIENLNLKTGALIKGITNRLGVSQKTSISVYFKKIELLDKEGEYKRKIEEIKKRLNEKGYFSIDRKREISPLKIKNVCVITSIQGAVIKDILKNIRKKNKNINVYCIDCRVQGDGAEKTIKDALLFANEIQEKYNFDVIIIARGGGSLMDLMPYNDEELNEAIFSSKIPVISAVGHQENWSISDYVADHRCSTPTEAGEFVAYDQYELEDLFKETLNQINLIISQKFEQKEKLLNSTLETIYISGINNIESKILESKKNIEFFTMLLENKIREKENTLKHTLEFIQQNNISDILRKGFTLSTDPITNKYIKYQDLKKDKVIRVEGNDYKLLAKVEEYEKK